MSGARRQRWLWSAVALYLFQLGSLLYSIAWHVGQPSGGFFPHPLSSSELPLVASPVTAEALAVYQRIGGTPRIEAINGRSVCESEAERRCGTVWARSLVDTTPGATNRFTLVGNSDAPPHDVEVRAGPMVGSVVLTWSWQSLAIAGVGLLFVVVGVVVWRARPGDPAAVPLLLFCVTAGMMLASPMYVDAFTLWVGALSRFSYGMLLPLMFLLGDSFSTRRPAWKTARFRVLLVLGAILALLDGGGRLAVLYGVVGIRDFVEQSQTAFAPGAAFAMALTLHSTWKASRPPSPLAQRRRAVVFAHAIVLGFAYPTLWILFRWAIFESAYQNLALIGLLVSFASFPTLLGYAIVRHRMFDLRIVVRQGLVYAVLSVGLTLVYLLLVLSALRAMGELDSAVAISAAIVVAIGFGFARARVERWIDGVVFRGRAVFRDAIALAGRGLSTARSAPDVAGALKAPLIDALGLSRAYVSVATSDQLAVRHHLVANDEDPETGAVPPQLPESENLDEPSVVSRCLDTGKPAHAFAQQAGADDAFWEKHRLESVVPFGASDRGGRGALLLGPKKSGRPFDPEDTALVSALADQVSLALENAEAFQKLAAQRHTVLQLVQGIVHEANSPLAALRSSIDMLPRGLDKLTASDAALRDRAELGLRSVASTAGESSARLSELIDGLKRFVNLEEAQRRPTDLRRCIHDALASLPKEIAPERVAVREPDSTAWVDAYPAKLRHVLANVLENALRASAPGAQVLVDIHQRAASWRVVVKDTGSGIPPDVLEHVFEFGISEKRAGHRFALRLGLPYAKHVVEDLDGHIGIESAVGRGTSVTIELLSLARHRG